MSLINLKITYLFLLSFILFGCVTQTPQTAVSNTQIPSAGQGNADVVFVKAVQNTKQTWTFHVTVSHPDTGWDDYADGWDVVLANGDRVKLNKDDPFTRLLLHPHETEQPFTRSQSNLEIPADTITVTVRAHDLVDGWGGQEIVLDLSQANGLGFEVLR